MNCKQGDIAIIIRSEAGNLGKIVTCVEFIGNAPNIGLFNLDNFKNWWKIDTDLTYRDVFFDVPVGAYPYIPDECLRPLRDTDGEDEMITLVGKPQEVYYEHN